MTRSALPGEIGLLAGILVSSLALLVVLGCGVTFAEADILSLGDSTGVRRAALVLGAVMVLANGRWCALLMLAFFARLPRPGTPTAVERLPYVSIFVPCCNESRTIDAALQSLRKLDYPAYEVIVVNDGSADDTLGRAKRFSGDFGDCTVRVYDKPNGGKWTAHNLAFQRSQGELILFIDADSRLDRHALRRLVACLADPQVDGVAGQVRVRNRTCLLTRLQGLEYLMSNGAVRLGQGLFGTVLTVPGPIGLFRRSVLEEVWLKYGDPDEPTGPGAVAGPLSGDTFAEDFDLSLAVLCLGARIVYEPAAISYTKAPDTHFALINQRYRWIRGNMQVLKKFVHRARSDLSVLSPRLVAWVAATCAVDLLLTPLLYYLGLILVLILVVEGCSAAMLAATFLMFLLVHLNAGAFFVFVHRDSLRLLAVLPLLSFYNGFVLNSAWVISVMDELRGRSMRW